MTAVQAAGATAPQAAQGAPQAAQALQALQAPSIVLLTREIRLNSPKVFGGNQLKFRHFHQDILLYLSINNHIFQTDEQKIAFIHSYLAEKEAAQWRESWVARNMDAATNNIVYPTWGVFIMELAQDFSLIDKIGDAMHTLQTL